jgi:hypothetical protein
MLTLETALAATVAGLTTVGLLLTARRTPPSWLRRRLGLKEVR